MTFAVSCSMLIMRPSSNKLKHATALAISCLNVSRTTLTQNLDEIDGQSCILLDPLHPRRHPNAGRTVGRDDFSKRAYVLCFPTYQSTIRIESSLLSPVTCSEANPTGKTSMQTLRIRSTRSPYTPSPIGRERKPLNLSQDCCHQYLRIIGMFSRFTNGPTCIKLKRVMAFGWHLVI